MQISATDFSIAVILQPAEATVLLDRLNRNTSASSLADAVAEIDRLHEELADFVNGPDDDLHV
jgi:hypothetical protein